MSGGFRAETATLTIAEVQTLLRKEQSDPAHRRMLVVKMLERKLAQFSSSELG